jgi:hypothetical protein
LLDVNLGPREAAFGCRIRIAVDSGRGARMFDVRLPPGLTDGDVVELAHQGTGVTLRVCVASAV